MRAPVIEIVGRSRRLEHIDARFGHPAVVHVPWFPEEVRGLERLRAVGRCLRETPAVDAMALRS